MVDGDFVSDKPDIEQLKKMFNQLRTDKEMSGKILININIKRTIYAFLPQNESPAF